MSVQTSPKTNRVHLSLHAKAEGAPSVAHTPGPIWHPLGCRAIELGKSAPGGGRGDLHRRMRQIFSEGHHLRGSMQWLMLGCSSVEEPLQSQNTMVGQEK